jgi:GH25 family lysozyme M1 (1,4-beta-N-acetylmuramidase)
MRVVGPVIEARRGLMLAGLVIALTALLSVSASDAATTRAKGLDVSNWNGAINWTKVAKAGYRFAFGKATEGTSYNDKTYTTNRNGSEAAGLVFGAYHFARPTGTNLAGATASAIKQANHFLNVAGPQPGELPPVLDLEKTGNLSKQRLLAWTLAWLGQIDARTGVQPFVYTSPLFWKGNLGDSTAAAAAGTGLWIAHWTSNSQPTVPAKNWNGTGWRFWQWTDCATVPGVNHCSDGDRMNGSKLTSVAIDPFPGGPPLLSTPPTIVGPPQAGQLLAAVPGLWEGGKPITFAYQWRRCDAAGANCVAITGATGETYRPVSDDVGHSLKAFVTATATAGAATTATSPTAAVTPAGTSPGARPTNLKPPVIAGTAQAGQILTSSVGTWTGSPSKFTYRWRRCNASGVSCLAIPHATGPHRTLTPDDIGATLSLVVTATGTGGAASATATASGIVVAAPLPAISTGTQTVRRGIAGNLQTDDGRASVTWQPGAVPVGKTVSLTAFDNALAVPNSGVSLSVQGLSSKGFLWPLDLMYAKPQPVHTVLGYSLNGKVYQAVPTLQPASLPAGTALGWYVDGNGLTHVLTRTPFQVSLFKHGAWGDPTYTSATGPALATQTKFQALPHPADGSVLLLTLLAVHSQARMAAKVTGPHGVTVPILGKGSRFGSLLPAGILQQAQSYRRKPGSMQVRLRLNAHTLVPGAYSLRVTAVDPWGRHGRLTLRFRYR